MVGAHGREGTGLDCRTPCPHLWPSFLWLRWVLWQPLPFLQSWQFEGSCLVGWVGGREAGRKGGLPNLVCLTDPKLLLTPTAQESLDVVSVPTLTLGPFPQGYP